MPNSVLVDLYGPDWPLGFIKVVTPGTPVNIMSLVDASSVNDPGNPTGSIGEQEYTVTPYAILFTACKPGASHGFQLNTGNIYICRKGQGSGTGNRDDQGAIVKALPPGALTNIDFPSFLMLPINREKFSPYRYSIDADNANDGCLVTLFL